MIDYLVTGTGRCGTVFFARLLTSLGIPCSHEGIFTFDGLDTALERLNDKSKVLNSATSRAGQWLHTKNVLAESSYMSAPFLQHEALKNTKIIHIVRHPIYVIHSFVDDLKYFFKKSVSEIPNRYHRFIYNNCRELTDPKMDAMTRASLYYIRWNQMIEKNLENKESIFHRIEDDLLPVIEFLGKEPKQEMYNNTKANSKRKTPTFRGSMDNIPESSIKKELLAICEKYNYSENLTHKTTKFKLFI